MVTRDMYVTMLEKRASDGIDIFSGVDNQEVANKEHASNILDQRSEVSSLFASADKASKDMTSVLAKALPKAKKTEGTTSSSTLMKVAMNTAFFDGLRETGLLKTASPEYIRATYNSFNEELGKIAMLGAIAKTVAKGAKSLSSGAKGLVTKKPAAAWGPGKVLQGATKASKPSTVNWGGY